MKIVLDSDLSSLQRAARPARRARCGCLSSSARSAALAGALLLGFAVGLASASAGTRLSVGPRSGAPGESLSTPIEVASDEGLVALQLDLRFDQNLAAINTVAAEPYATDHVLRSELMGDGRRRVLLYSPTNEGLPDGVIGEAQLSLQSGFPADEKGFSLSDVRFVTETGATLQVALAPFVRLEAPLGGATFDEWSETELSALAVETEGEVTRVEFLVDGRVVATDSSAPFSGTWLVDGVGNAVLSAVAYDSEGEASLSPGTSVAVEPADFLQAWREIVFSPEQQTDADISGATADPDGDGIMNFLEFALGLDPLVADTSGLPEVELEELGGERFLTLSFEKPSEVAALRYVVEVSNDLVNWESSPDWVNQEELGETESGQRVRARALRPVPEGEEDKAFIRLRMEPVE